MSEKTVKRDRRDAEKPKYLLALTGPERWWTNAMLVSKQDVKDRADRRVLDHVDSCLIPEDIPDSVSAEELSAMEGVDLRLSQTQFDKLYGWMNGIPHNTRCARALRRVYRWLDACHDGEDFEDFENACEDEDEASEAPHDESGPGALASEGTAA